MSVSLVARKAGPCQLVVFRDANDQYYPESFAQPGHRARVLLLYSRKCVPTCFVVEGVVVRCSCTLFLGLLRTFCFDLCVSVVNKLPTLSPNRVRIMSEWSWKSHGSSMGSPWCAQGEQKKLNLGFSSVFKLFYKGNLEKQARFLYFWRLPPGQLFIDFWMILAVFCWHLWWLFGK